MLEIKNPYTRKIDRQYSEILTEGATVTNDQNGNQTFSLSSANGCKADDFLVMSLTGCTQDEVDNLSPKEHALILEKINKMRNSGSVGE